ncbi:MAG TPA: hypothetical protein PKB04_01850 [Phenylobacterium sp.]|nr:hypothetical protein [Phenylobacterium sp.]
MKPIAPQVLADLAGLSLRNAAPDVAPAARAGQLGLSALLLGLAAEMWDGAADLLVRENAELRALLADGAVVSQDSARGRWLSELASGREDSLKISDLETANAELKVALIALHAEVEMRADPQARSMETRVWETLARSTERRRLSGSPC